MIPLRAYAMRLGRRFRRLTKSRNPILLVAALCIVVLILVDLKNWMFMSAANTPGLVSLAPNTIQSIFGSSDYAKFASHFVIDDPRIVNVLGKKELSSDDKALLEAYFGFDPTDIKAIQQKTLFQIHRSKLLDLGESYKDWTKMAYVQYATDYSHICSAVINFERLKALKVEADFLFIYSGNKTTDADERKTERLMLSKIEDVGAQIKYVPKIDLPSKSSYWSESFTKLYAFDLTEYDRVIFLDSDSLVLQNMDELFSLPESILALPVNYINFRDFSNIKLDLDDAVTTPYDRSSAIYELYEEYITRENKYDKIEWLLKSFYPVLPSMKIPVELLRAYKLEYQLASYVMVIHPDHSIFKILMEALKHRKEDEYDMDVINNVFNLKKLVESRSNFYKLDTPIVSDSELISVKDQEYIPLVQIIPHNPYALLSGEFRKLRREHDCYLSDPHNLPELGYNYPDLKSRLAITSVDGILKDEESDSFVHPEIPYWSWYWKPNVAGYGWDPVSILSDAKLIHFSDAPLPKPWISAPDLVEKLYTDAKNKCFKVTHNNIEGCERELMTWTKLYHKYEDYVHEYC